jgi:O-antigen/teichoic acid export membrane protein
VKNTGVAEVLEDLLKISRRKASQWHLFFLYTNFVFSLIKGVLIVPLYLRYMEPRLYGAWLACGGIIVYLSLCEFGVNRVLIQKVAVLASSSKTEQLASVVATGVRLNAGLAILPFLIGLGIAPFVAGIVQITGPEALDLRNAFILGALAASLMIFSFTPSGVLQGLQRQVFVNVCYTTGLALGILVTVVLLYAGYGLLAIPIGTLIHAGVTAVGNFSYMAVVLSRQGLLRWPRIDMGLFKEILGSSLFEFGGMAARSITTQSDNLIIGAALNPVLCNVFTFTGMAYKMSATLGGYVSNAAMPSLAHLVGESDADKTKRVIVDIIRISTIIGASLMCGALFLNEALVDIWVGPQFYGGVGLNLLFFLAAILMLFFYTFNNILVAFGDFRASGTAVMIQACVQLPLMVGLGYWAGMLGLAWASVLALAVVAIPIQAVALTRRLHVSPRDLISGAFALTAVFAIPIAAVVAMKYVWTPHGLIQLGLFCAAYAAISAACYAIIHKDLRDFVVGCFAKGA